MQSVKALLPELLSTESSVQVFSDVVTAVEMTATDWFRGYPDEVLVLAYALGALTVARSASALVPWAERPVELMGDLGRITSALHIDDSDDLAALKAFLASVKLDAQLTALLPGVTARHQTTLLVSLLWGIAQLTLCIDSPSVIESDGDLHESRTGNVVTVVGEPDRGIIISTRTSSRSEFLQIIEAKHAIDRYFQSVEDLWRKVGLLTAPFRVDVRFPMWRGRTLDSHLLSVDTKPISQLLMGTALYGDREHVWLRELIQNSVDATEMRRYESPSAPTPPYEPQISIELDAPDRVRVRDNGIGMSYQHVVRYLATLGRSGWRSISTQNPETLEGSYFGRFGIGFASVFPVSRAISVRTRHAATRPIDGLRVTFTGPDRPYFTEAISCAVGTEVTLDLAEPLTLGDLRNALLSNFVYVPTALDLPAELTMPASLDEYTAISRMEPPPRLDATASTVRSVRFAGFNAAVKCELLIPPRSDRPSEVEWPRSAPKRGVDVAIDGVRVFRRNDFATVPFEKKKAFRERSWMSDLELDGVFITLNFDRNEAPVFASRDRLDLDEAAGSAFEELVVESVAATIEGLFDGPPDDSPLSRQASRARFLHIASFVVKPYHVSTTKGFSSALVSPLKRKLSDLYRLYCPIEIHTEGSGEPEWRTFDELTLDRAVTAVRSGVAGARAFEIYAQDVGLTSWLVVASALESELLRATWPNGARLRILGHPEDLLRFLDEVAKEVREMEIVSLLRGDYAVMRSRMFGDGLFFKVPSTVSRHRGASVRRSAIDRSVRPRVALNAEHPVVTALETFLGTASESDRDQIGSWLDSFCDGVVEDKTKLAPAARWDQLRRDLLKRTGIDLRDSTFETLRVTF
jgi:hypothetical protein